MRHTHTYIQYFPVSTEPKTDGVTREGGLVRMYGGVGVRGCMGEVGSVLVGESQGT